MVIVIDGAQAGTHSSPAIFTDDFGLPTLSALCRAVQLLAENGIDKT
jgi:methylamine---glutamate N-methyltransferase subunit C